MVSIPNSAPTSSSPSYGAKGICYIVGLVCIVGFFADMLILGLPPQPGNLQWRVSILQQFGDRSIILLFGTALILFGNIGQRRSLKRLSRFCLLGGVIFLLLCLLAIADSMALQQRTLTTISTQESQLQTQIRNAQENPDAIGDNITAEDLQQASQLLANQANSLKQNAKTSTIKTGAANVSNLIIVGLGLIGLGRYGMSLRKG
jgi:predicted PurR-regulated permease PerM